MKPVASVSQIRLAEEYIFVSQPNVDLMRLAAGVVAATALEMLSGRGQVLVIAGPGNNGGDGLFAACDLAARGCPVLLCLPTGSSHVAGLASATEAGCRVLDVAAALTVLDEVDLVIDAVLGIGGRPGLPQDVDLLAQACRDLAVPVLSVDIPSGLDADSHLTSRCFTANTTVTFGALKLCHVAQPAATHCGRVLVADIGLALPDTDVYQVEEADLARMWPVPGPESDKYSRGVVGIDTGSASYPGAAILGCLGALHAGAGMIRHRPPWPMEAVASALIHRAPSVVQAEGRVNSWLVGSGWGEDNNDGARLTRRFSDGVPMVVDADALPLLSDPRSGQLSVALSSGLPANSLLTPHAGELAKMLSVERADVVSAPIAAAREVAQRTGATVLLKGATQYVVAPEGPVLVAFPGPAWTAQAGSGDVLAGVCATLLAAGLPAREAAVLGASLQALTALRFPGPVPPDVLAGHFAEVIAELTGRL